MDLIPFVRFNGRISTLGGSLANGNLQIFYSTGCLDQDVLESVEDLRCEIAEVLVKGDAEIHQKEVEFTLFNSSYFSVMELLGKVVIVVTEDVTTEKGGNQ